MVSDAVTIFFAQFFMIFLLGSQSITVNRGHKALAAINSLLLGLTGFHVTGIVSSAYAEGMFSLVWWSFICAGPLGIVASINLYPRMSKFIASLDRRKTK